MSTLPGTWAIYRVVMKQMGISIVGQGDTGGTSVAESLSGCAVGFIVSQRSNIIAASLSRTGTGLVTTC